jgi:putative colanic acid biosysnthesis UDP-glucose lipid carrier transferase
MTKGRYSKYLRPISISIDCIILSLLAYLYFKLFAVYLPVFIAYLVFSWCVLAFFTGFYEVYRFTKPIEIATMLFRQFILYSLLVMAFFSVSREIIASFSRLLFFLSFSFLGIAFFKSFFYNYLKKIRVVLGGNGRKSIIIGYTESAINLKNLFETRPDYGYHFQGFFSDNVKNQEVKGTVAEIQDYVLENKIDEIYCALKELTNEQLKKLIDFADINSITIKFIPESNEIYAKNLKIDYYEFFPVLSIKKTPLDEPLNHFLKRFFDICFSLLVIVFVLSWLLPIIAILIKLESKGPVFFIQKRNGLDFKEFDCYKLRSMTVGASLDPVKPGDERVTKIGEFIRKTNIDELPQCFNALIGNMSIVGPRPHEPSYNKMYTQQTKIDKYMMRHHIKPGITGLAQIKGYRGEVIVDNDIINRVKLDLFYIENWSLLLDIKIILTTIENLFKGQEKAY